MTNLAHLKPRYHVRPDTGWVNDPNGPVVDSAGVIHLFFQSRPQLRPDTPVEWGHATSTDWVHWEVIGPAIEPGAHPVAADGIWSGNTVSAPDGVRAYFSGFRRDHPYQSILTAAFDASRQAFTDVLPCVADPEPAEQVAQFRDPYVWRDSTSWQMAVGTGYADETPAVRLYRSEDGFNWQPRGDLVRGPGPSVSPYGFMWECPQVLHSAGNAAVLISVMDRQVDGFGPVLCLAFDSAEAGSTAQITNTTPVDHGPDFYAASLLRTESGGVLWGWVTEAREQSWWTEDGWAGALSLPRQVRLGPDGDFRCVPLPALGTLRESETAQTGREIGNLPAQLEFELDIHRGRPQELVLEAGRTERLRLVIDESHQELVVDRSASSLDTRANRDPIYVPLPQSGTIRGFIDGSILEIYLPDSTAATARWYPTTPPPWRLLSTQADVRVWHLTTAISSRAAPVAGP